MLGWGWSWSMGECRLGALKASKLTSALYVWHQWHVRAAESFATAASVKFMLSKPSKRSGQSLEPQQRRRHNDGCGAQAALMLRLLRLAICTCHTCRSCFLTGACHDMLPCWMHTMKAPRPGTTCTGKRGCHAAALSESTGAAPCVSTAPLLTLLHQCWLMMRRASWAKARRRRQLRSSPKEPRKTAWGPGGTWCSASAPARCHRRPLAGRLSGSHVPRPGHHTSPVISGPSPTGAAPRLPPPEHSIAISGRWHTSVCNPIFHICPTPSAQYTW